MYSTQSVAQSPAKVYSTFSNFFDEKYIVVDLNLLWQPRTDETLHGGSAYTIVSEKDSLLTVDLKEYYPLVYIDDMLFVNCRFIEGSGFGEVIYMNDKFCFFIGPYTDVARFENSTAIYGGLAGNIIMDAVTETMMDGNKHLYAINIDRLYGEYVNMDYMKDLLGKNSKLYTAYRAERKRNKVDVIIKYVKAHFGETPAEQQSAESQ